MSAEIRCALTELLKAECSHCRGLDEEEILNPRTLDYSFVAAHYSRCADCADGIEPGDHVHRLTDGSIICAQCWKDFGR